jgi:hypothetical protein
MHLTTRSTSPVAGKFTVRRNHRRQNQGYWTVIVKVPV